MVLVMLLCSPVALRRSRAFRHYCRCAPYASGICLVKHLAPCGCHGQANYPPLLSVIRRSLFAVRRSLVVVCFLVFLLPTPDSLIAVFCLLAKCEVLSFVFLISYLLFAFPHACGVKTLDSCASAFFKSSAQRKRLFFVMPLVMVLVMHLVLPLFIRHTQYVILNVANTGNRTARTSIAAL